MLQGFSGDCAEAARISITMTNVTITPVIMEANCLADDSRVTYYSQSRILLRKQALSAITLEAFQQWIT